MNKQEKRRVNIAAHPYVPHLLEDIKAAHRPEESEPAESSIEDYLEEVDRYIYGERHPGLCTFGDHCGLEPADFPPPEQLIDRDIEMICDAFEDLLFSWNARLSLPENIPLCLRYKLTVGVLSEEFIPMSIGYITFDYCSGYAPDCPLGEYCPCLEIWNDDEEED